MLDVKISKSFAGETGGPGFSLEASFASGDGITVLFGPSGSGKTTILRSIAGLVAPDSGRIAVNEQTYFDSARKVNLPVQERRVGFVFQDYLLFPHLTAEQNVAYGIREGSDRARRDKTNAMLELLAITHVAKRRPRELSGGEQQRVALARALASEPKVLLLDEPLSAVDAATRSRLLDELADIQRRTRIPFLYVTHSPADAVRAGDSAVILEAGRVVEQGKLPEVFNSPRDSAAARAVGDENVLAARVVEQLPSEGITMIDAAGCRLAMASKQLALGTSVTVGIPSDDIIVSRERIRQTSARNLLAGTVKHVIQCDPAVELIIDCGVSLRARVTTQAVKALEISPGATVYLLIKASACRVLP